MIGIFSFKHINPIEWTLNWIRKWHKVIYFFPITCHTYKKKIIIKEIKMSDHDWLSVYFVSRKKVSLIERILVEKLCIALFFHEILLNALSNIINVNISSSFKHRPFWMSFSFSHFLINNFLIKNSHKTISIKPFTVM